MGFDPGVIHALDSAALSNMTLRNGCRLRQLGHNRKNTRRQLQADKVGYIEADIEEIDWVTKGVKLGSGSVRTLRSNTRIGIISAGWVNGVGLSAAGAWESVPVFDRLKRVLKNDNSPVVRINGMRVKTIGQVGLTSFTADITSVNCSTGDKAIIECDPRLAKGLDIVYR